MSDNAVKLIKEDGGSVVQIIMYTMVMELVLFQHYMQNNGIV